MKYKFKKGIMNIFIFIISINAILGKKNLMGHHESGFTIRSVADQQSISVGIVGTTLEYIISWLVDTHKNVTLLSDIKWEVLQ